MEQHLPHFWSSIRKKKGWNSIKVSLSRVNWWTDIRFLRWWNMQDIIQSKIKGMGGDNRITNMSNVRTWHIGCKNLIIATVGIMQREFVEISCNMVRGPGVCVLVGVGSTIRSHRSIMWLKAGIVLIALPTSIGSVTNLWADLALGPEGVVGAIGSSTRLVGAVATLRAASTMTSARAGLPKSWNRSWVATPTMRCTHGRHGITLWRLSLEACVLLKA
jgi:hypothetical protein